MSKAAETPRRLARVAMLGNPNTGKTSLFNSLTKTCDHCAGGGRVYTPSSVVRQIERSLSRVSAKGDERQIMIRMHPEVTLRILEDEPDFLKRIRNRTQLSLDMRDDPLLREDEFRILSGTAETDVTARYAAS